MQVLLDGSVVVGGGGHLVCVSLLTTRNIIVAVLRQTVPFPFTFTPNTGLKLTGVVALLTVFALPCGSDFGII